MRDKNELTVYEIKELYDALSRELVSYMHLSWGQHGGKFVEIGHEMHLSHYYAMTRITPRQLFHYIDLRMWSLSFPKTLFLCEVYHNEAHHILCTT